MPCGWISSTSPTSRSRASCGPGRPSRPNSAVQPSLNTHEIPSGSLDQRRRHQHDPLDAGAAGELRGGLPLGRSVVGQSLGCPGALVGLPVDPGRVQAAEVLLRGQHRGMTEQITQHQQRVRFGQIESQRGVGVGVLDQLGGLPVVAGDQVFQGPHGEGVAQPVRMNVREPRLEPVPDPVGGALEHRRPGGERTAAVPHRQQARTAVRGDQPTPLARGERVPPPADPVDPPAPGVRVGHQQRLAPPCAAAATSSRPRSRRGRAPGSGAPPPARRRRSTWCGTCGPWSPRPGPGTGSAPPIGRGGSAGIS